MNSAKAAFVSSLSAAVSARATPEVVVVPTQCNGHGSVRPGCIRMAACCFPLGIALPLKSLVGTILTRGASSSRSVRAFAHPPRAHCSGKSGRSGVELVVPYKGAPESLVPRLYKDENQIPPI